MVGVAEDTPVIVVDVQGLVEEVVELEVLAQLAQAHKLPQQMLEVMEETQHLRVRHGLAELMVIH
jgi:hypothetical protein|tara:strand:+ start:335 stop:529 length:195 start_codon:yes stop_codon:yes gene_type:complete